MIYPQETLLYLTHSKMDIRKVKLQDIEMYQLL